MWAADERGQLSPSSARLALDGKQRTLTSARIRIRIRIYILRQTNKGYRRRHCQPLLQRPHQERSHRAIHLPSHQAIQVLEFWLLSYKTKSPPHTHAHVQEHNPTKTTPHPPTPPTQTGQRNKTRRYELRGNLIQTPPPRLVGEGQKRAEVKAPELASTLAGQYVSFLGLMQTFVCTWRMYPSRGSIRWATHSG